MLGFLACMKTKALYLAIAQHINGCGLNWDTRLSTWDTLLPKNAEVYYELLFRQLYTLSQTCLLLQFFLMLHSGTGGGSTTGLVVTSLGLLLSDKPARVGVHLGLLCLV